MKTKNIKNRINRHITVRPEILREIQEASKRTGIPQSRLVEQGWDMRRKTL